MCGRDEFMHDERYLSAKYSKMSVPGPNNIIGVFRWNKRFNPGGHMASNKLTRSEQKRFDEANRVALNRMNALGSVFPTDTLQALRDADLLDLRSPARKAAEESVIASVRSHDKGVTTWGSVQGSIVDLNAVIASESAPSVEWRKELLTVSFRNSWGARMYADGELAPKRYQVPTEAAADVLVAHLNSVERGKC